MENCKAEEPSSGQNSIPLRFQPESHLKFPGPSMETNMPSASTTECFATAETWTGMLIKTVFPSGLCGEGAFLTGGGGGSTANRTGARCAESASGYLLSIKAR